VWNNVIVGIVLFSLSIIGPMRGTRGSISTGRPLSPAR
jgi:hypothetical protein